MQDASVSMRSFAAAAAILVCLSPAGLRAQGIDLAPHGMAAPLRVRADIEVSGSLVARANLPGLKKEANQTAFRRLPMTFRAAAAYDEGIVSPVNGPGGVHRTVRMYDSARGTLTIDGVAKELALSPETRRILGRCEREACELLSPDGPLDREELDLLTIIGEPIRAAELLPSAPQQVEAEWQVAPAAVGPLLGMNSVSDCQLEGKMTEANARYAKLEWYGDVTGAIEGAAVDFDVRGVGLFDRQLGVLTQLNWAVRENRRSGPATPGFEGVIKSRWTLAPAESPAAEVTKFDAAEFPALEAVSRELSLAVVKQGIACRHDRQWFVASTDSGSVTLRRIGGPNVIADATIRRLPPRSPSAPATLARFEGEVRTAVGGAFGKVSRAEEWRSDLGANCLSLTVAGQVENVPVEQRYYLVVQQNGEQASVVVTVADDMTQRLAENDRQLIDSLALTAAPKAAYAKPAPQAPVTVKGPSAPVRSARAPMRSNRRR